MGGLGSAIDGTFVSTHLQAGSHPDKSIARELGRVAGREASAVGCNILFAPVADIHLNWRNTVVATRSFGNEAELVAERAIEYFLGASESGIACTAKHFPGDGVDERDQHLATTYNTLDWPEWRASFGRVYEKLVGAGIQAVMVGHIAAPKVAEHLGADLEAQRFPATVSSILIDNLLRRRLGFNGLVISDATEMIGLTQTLPRRALVPRVIAAGCDMFLYFRLADEDFQYMIDGYHEGVITEERLQSALRRVLGLKAALGLLGVSGRELVPEPDRLAVVGCEEHRAIAARVADRTVTLVKDTQQNLPITPATHPRIRLYGVHGERDFTGTHPSAYLTIFEEELRLAGFDVDVYRTLGERLAAGEAASPHSVMHEEFRDYSSRFDAAILVANVKGFAREATERIKWSSPMSPEIPWYVNEVPTVFVSTHHPNHLIDVPMVKTVIHTYADTREAIRATVQKLIGNSTFEGTFNDNVFCDSPDTRF
jgi:beta-N-acetylhexosaminidase